MASIWQYHRKTQTNCRIPHSITLFESAHIKFGFDDIFTAASRRSKSNKSSYTTVWTQLGLYSKTWIVSLITYLWCYRFYFTYSYVWTEKISFPTENTANIEVALSCDGYLLTFTVSASIKANPDVDLHSGLYKMIAYIWRIHVAPVRKTCMLCQLMDQWLRMRVKLPAFGTKQFSRTLIIL